MSEDRPKLAAARTAFHRELSEAVLHVRGERTVKGETVSVFSNADKDSALSVDLAARVAAMLPGAGVDFQGGSKVGRAFERAVCSFISAGIDALSAEIPWRLQTGEGIVISRFSQYRHLDEIQAAIDANAELEAVIGGDYLVEPDVVVWRDPLLRTRLDEKELVVDPGRTVRSPVLADDLLGTPILHASVSCKWTLRSDRGQNARTEALNLIRNRKGRAPHIVAVTMEPLPSRLASIAIGTGDIDCVYHAALDELLAAAESGAAAHGGAWAKAKNRLEMMVRSGRLRDVGDLPLDLLA